MTLRGINNFCQCFRVWGSGAWVRRIVAERKLGAQGSRWQPGLDYREIKYSTKLLNKRFDPQTLHYAPSKSLIKHLTRNPPNLT